MVEMNNKKREAQSTKDEKYKVYFAFDNEGESFESGWDVFDFGLGYVI